MISKFFPRLKSRVTHVFFNIKVMDVSKFMGYLGRDYQKGEDYSFKKILGGEDYLT